MTFKYNFALNNSDLPLYQSLAEQMIAISSLTDWFQFEDAFCTVSGGKVSTLASRKTSAVTFAQGTGAQQASLLTDQINGHPAGDFVPGVHTNYLISANPTLTGELTWVIIFKPELDASFQGIASVFTSSTVRCGIGISTVSGLAQGYVGASNRSTAFTLNAWNVAFLEKDATDVRIRVNGVSTATTPHNNAVGSATMTLGGSTGVAASYDGKLSDLMMFDAKIIDDEDIMATITDYCTTIYGLTDV